MLPLIKSLKSADTWESLYAFLNSLTVLIKAFSKSSMVFDFISNELIGENCQYFTALLTHSEHRVRVLLAETLKEIFTHSDREVIEIIAS